jgi:hypothetical protein
MVLIADLFTLMKVRTLVIVEYIGTLSFIIYDFFVACFALAFVSKKICNHFRNEFQLDHVYPTRNLCTKFVIVSC